MPACTCPHCRTQLAIKDSQLNLAQGFVVCTKCEGLFKAKDHLTADAQTPSEKLPPAKTDVKLVHGIGSQIRHKKQLSRNEIADLLDGVLHEQGKNAVGKNKAAKSGNAVWAWASLAAFAVLVMQLFYLAVPA